MPEDKKETTAAETKQDSLAETPKSQSLFNMKDKAPEYIKEGLGSEKVEVSDITLPRLAICQGLTPQKKKSDPNYIENLKDGDMFNSVTGQNYGTKLVLVPILFSKQRIKFNPLEDGGGIDCQSFNAKNGGRLHPDSCLTCEHSQFTGDGKPACDEFHNRISFLVDHSEVVIPSWKSSMLKVSKNWNALVQLSGRSNPFSRMYEIEVVEVNKNSFSWFMPRVRALKWTPEDLYEMMQTFYDSMKDKRVSADQTGTAEEAREEDFNTAQM